MNCCILVKASAFYQDKINRYYSKPLIEQRISEKNIFNYPLSYDKDNTCKAAFAKTFLAKLLPFLEKDSISLLVVTDAAYYKFLTKQKTTFGHQYVQDCVLPGYENIKAVYVPSFQILPYNPDIQKTIDTGIQTIAKYIHQVYVLPEQNVVHTHVKCLTPAQFEQALQDLHQYPVLTCDIETRGLKFYSCGISSIGFAWSVHDGITSIIDRSFQADKFKKILKQFIIDYQGKLIFHNAPFDCKVLIYELWMKSLDNYIGLIDGLNIICDKLEDTRIMAYLCLNSTARVDLSLKHLSSEYLGDYAVDNIHNTELISYQELLDYNLKDCLKTYYLYLQYSKQLIQEQQDQLYFSLFRPALKTVIQMELTGMPISMVKVQELKQILLDEQNQCLTFFQNNHLIQEFHTQQLELTALAATQKAKKKIYTIDDPVIYYEFNPNSDIQLQKFIYQYLGYSPLDFTKKKAPAVSGKALKKLLVHSKDPNHIKIFEKFIDFKLANKILTSFIPHFEQAQQLADGSHRLYGNFLLGGTISGRMASNSPNLQNIPANSKYGKAVKQCFISTPDWLFTGSDFDSLEDRINALVTRDTNKLKVYTDGYDGHCLRAAAYFSDKMPDIQDTSVQTINSIKHKYPELRQLSKAPTFALTYQGTYLTLINSCGFDKDTAIHIEKNYQTLYKESLAWVNKKLEQALVDGYVVGAFGLKLRTPILHKSVAGKLTHYAEKEKRSAGNAISGQSYGLLTTRAGIEFQERCLQSPYKYDIRPTAHIHDAIYLLIKPVVEIIHWVNINLIECMAWQDLPELQHPTIRITSGLDLFMPDWSKPVTLKNNCSEAEIEKLLKTAK